MSEATSIMVRVPLAIRRRPGRKTVVTPVVGASEAAVPMRADPALVKALARAFPYQRLLDEGRYASITEMAAAERIDRGYLGCVLQLTLLAPDIVEAILNGRQHPRLGLSGFMEPFPVAWPEQHQALLGACAAHWCPQPICRSMTRPSAGRCIHVLGACGTRDRSYARPDRRMD